MFTARTRAPREEYRVPRPGSVANSPGTRRNTFSTVRNEGATYTNSQGQLTPAQMNKMTTLIKTTDSLFNRLATRLKDKTCPRKPEELNLFLYSEILKDPRQTEEAKYDVMMQLVALKQVLKGERVVDRNTVSIFKKNERAITIIAVVLACVGFVMPLGALVDMVQHADPAEIQSAKNDLLEKYRLQYKNIKPEISDEKIRDLYYKEFQDVNIRATVISGRDHRPISAALSSMGTGILGFIPSLISSFVTAAVGPLPVVLILKAGKNFNKRVNLQEAIEEIELIIQDRENPPGLAESVEKELKITAIAPPSPEELAQMTAPEAAAPLQAMNDFMERGVGANGLPRTVQRLNNFTRNANTPARTISERTPKRGIQFASVNNEFNANLTNANANAVRNSRKGFTVKSGLFTTAKGRQAQANANNARLNAEWYKRHPKQAHMPEATRTLNGKKSAFKKGGRKTRKNRK